MNVAINLFVNDSPKEFLVHICLTRIIDRVFTLQHLFDMGKLWYLFLPCSVTEQVKLREEELDEALNRAREQAASGIVDDQTVKTLGVAEFNVSEPSAVRVSFTLRSI